MSQYPKIILLSAGINQNANGPHSFSNNIENFNYEILGDPYEFRFKAVRKLFVGNACPDFILVGGQVEKVENGRKSKFIGKGGKTIPKAEVMRYCLINNYNIPKENISATLESESNTYGNAEAVSKYFKEKTINNVEKIGILTSFYHLSRSVKIFKELNLPLIPICAESVIYDEEFDSIKDFYDNEGFSKILADTKNSNSEIKGMGDQEKNSYTSGFK